MSPFFVAPIVEGKGEVEAVPRLLRRFHKEVSPPQHLVVNPPIRVKAGSFLNDSKQFQRHLALAALKAKAYQRGIILILLDCEDDCPATLGPELLRRARETRPDVPATIALAYREYETWFLAAAPSLGGIGGLPEELEAPPNPEAIRGAKEWLSKRLPGGYSEVNHQSLFTEAFSFTQAAAVKSFARLHGRMKSFFAHQPPPSSM